MYPGRRKLSAGKFPNTFKNMFPSLPVQNFRGCGCVIDVAVVDARKMVDDGPILIMIRAEEKSAADGVEPVNTVWANSLEH